MKRIKNIWFKCPACSKRLVVESEAAGYQSDCPDCRVHIIIPKRSTILSPAKRTFLTSIVQASVLVTCVAMGWWWASARSLDPQIVPMTETINIADAGTTATAETEPVSGNAMDPAATDAMNQKLISENMVLQGRYDKLLNWMMDNYRGKYPLPENLVSRLRIKPVTEDNALNPELAEALQMSEKEQSLVQDIFDYVKESLTAAEMERALISNQSDDSITISVPTYEEIGSEIREDLFLTLETTLGVHRFDRMVDIAGTDMKEQFHYYGEASRTLTFQVIYPHVQGEHEPYVLIRDGWIVPDSDSVRLTKITETAINNLPEAYRDYESMLPPGVSQYATP